MTRAIRGGDGTPVRIISDSDLRENGGEYALIGGTVRPVHGLVGNDKDTRGGNAIYVYPVTTEQIQGIYTGQINNWSEVGGQDAQLLAYQRDHNSGSQELMKSLVMKDLEMIDAPAMIAHGMMGPIDRVNEERNGLGFSV